jgi:hypothetical protein
MKQDDNAKARDLYWKPLSWLGTISPTSATDAFDPALWTTFVSTTLGLEVPMPSLPRCNNSPLAKCGCKKHCESSKTSNSLRLPPLLPESSERRHLGIEPSKNDSKPLKSVLKNNYIVRTSTKRRTFTATTQPPVQLTQVQPRRTTGWYLSLALCFARLDTRSHTTRGHVQRRPTARRRGDPQLPTRPSGQQPEPGLRSQHHP